MGINKKQTKTIDKQRPTDVSVSLGHFFTCMERATLVTQPYNYWLLRNVFPEEMVEEIEKLPFPEPGRPIFDGRRESNNSSRVYFTKENQDTFSVCREVVSIFSQASTLALLEEITQTDLSKGHLRVEYCQDIDGFWLEPHLDISVKLFTMLVYLSDDPNLFDAGTDIYDSSPEHNRVATAPYEQNAGLIFIPGKNTWHGFSKRVIKGLRKSIIINYVSEDWLNREELAYQ